MPFLGRRIRENLVLFLLMGALYFVIYHRVSMPDTQYALYISYGGTLAIEMLLYIWCMYIYLLNVGELKVYIRANLISYGVYAVIFYIVYMLSELLGGVFGTVYSIFFLPFGVGGCIGLNTLLSSSIVHVLFIAVIFAVPLLVHERYDLTEEYFNSLEDRH